MQGMRVVETPGGAVVLRSAALERAGVPHAFSTRRGGVSAGWFESLNFGNPGGLAAGQRDPAANIAENYRRLLAAAGCSGRERVEVHQVHGAGVLVVRAGAPAHGGGAGAAAGGVGASGAGDTKADAIVSDDAGRALAVRTADCAPVLMASGDGRVVAAVHAGWRGIVAGVATAAVGAMRGLGAGEIVAAVGPCIGQDAFEVGPEVAEEFRRVLGEAAPLRRGRGDRWHADLAGALEAQLRAAGIREIDRHGGCTHAEGALFFSHRRDGERSGRMAAVIGAR